MTAQQNPVFLNQVTLGPGVASYPHLEQARDFKGNGDFRYDIILIVTPQLGKELNDKAMQIVPQFFQPAEYQSPFFRWPAKLIDQALWPDCPAHYLQQFPQHYAVKVGRKQGKGKPMQRNADNSEIVVPGEIQAGAIVAIIGDFMTFRMSGTNLGISFMLNSVYKLGVGAPMDEGGANVQIEQEDLDRMVAGAAPAMAAPAAMASTQAPSQPAQPVQPMQPGPVGPESFQ